MRLQLIVCKVLQKEAYFCAARSKNIVDVVLMKQGLHNEPDKLRIEVQKILDNIQDMQGNPYDASLLGYGLCSNGITGLTSKIPIVIPRGHDCITLLLGSKDRYQQYFDSHKGIYWFSSGWIDTGTQPGKERYMKALNEYREKYGEENAEYLMEMEQNWMKEYKWATYVDWEFSNSEQEKKYTKECADFLGWNYDQLKGDSRLMQNLLDGQWDEKDFLIVPPGKKVEEDLTNAGIIKAS